MKKTASQIARENFESYNYYLAHRPDGKIFRYYGPLVIPTYKNLNPNKGILELLTCIKNNPNLTRNQYKKILNKSLSCNTFQNLTWAKLITPRKYTITQLGLDLLAEYHIA